MWPSVKLMDILCWPQLLNNDSKQIQKQRSIGWLLKISSRQTEEIYPNIYLLFGWWLAEPIISQCFEVCIQKVQMVMRCKSWEARKNTYRSQGREFTKQIKPKVNILVFSLNKKFTSLKCNGVIIWSWDSLILIYVP